jgi:hypothetical protein
MIGAGLVSIGDTSNAAWQIHYFPPDSQSTRVQIPGQG